MAPLWFWDWKLWQIPFGLSTIQSYKPCILYALVTDNLMSEAVKLYHYVKTKLKI